MLHFHKVIVGDATIATKYISTAEQMLISLIEAGQLSSVFDNPEILIIAKNIGSVRKAIFLPKDVAPLLLTLKSSTYTFSFWKADVGKTLTKLGGDYDIRTMFNSATGLTLLTPYSLELFHSFNVSSCIAVRTGTPFDQSPIYSHASYGSVAYSSTINPPTAPYNITFALNNGAYSANFTQPAVEDPGNPGKYPVSLAVTAMVTQVNAAFDAVYSGYLMVQASGQSIVPSYPVLILGGGGSGTVSATITQPVQPNVVWPPSNDFGFFDRSGVYNTTSKTLTNTRLYDWQGGASPQQPIGWGLSVRDIMGEKRYAIDAQRELYTRTNDLGYEQQIGKAVIWEINNKDAAPYVTGQYKKLNTGLQSPASVVDIAALSSAYPDMADTQLVSIAHFDNYSTVPMEENNNSILATPKRFYLTYAESRVYIRSFFAYMIFGTTRTDPDTFIPGKSIVWQSRRLDGGSIKRYVWGGYIHDNSGEKSGHLDYCVCREAVGDEDLWTITPGLNLYIADETGDDNDVYGLWNATTKTVTDLYAVMGVTNPFPTPVTVTGADRDLYAPDSIRAYRYGNDIIVVSTLTSHTDPADRAIQSKIPSGVFAVDIATGTARKLYCGYTETTQTFTNDAAISPDGKYIYLLDEPLVRLSSPACFTHINVATGKVTRDAVKIPATFSGAVTSMLALGKRT